MGGSIVGLGFSISVDLLRMRLLRKRKRVRYSLVPDSVNGDGNHLSSSSDAIPLQANGNLKSENGPALMRDEEMGIDD